MAPRIAAFLAILALVTSATVNAEIKVGVGRALASETEDVIASPLLAYGIGASAGQFPWMAALVGQSTLCGGTLIGPSIVLTAGKLGNEFTDSSFWMLTIISLIHQLPCNSAAHCLYEPKGTNGALVDMDLTKLTIKIGCLDFTTTTESPGCEIRTVKVSLFFIYSDEI